nr:type IV secretory pathway, VirD4 components [Bradyrhizobium sp. DOA9]
MFAPERARARRASACTCQLEMGRKARSMSATKIIWHQVFLFCLVVLAFLWASTEWTAWRLPFQPRLGAPWFTVGGWPVYQPAAFLSGGSSLVPTRRGLLWKAEPSPQAAASHIALAMALSVLRAGEGKNVTPTAWQRWAHMQEVNGQGSWVMTGSCSAALKAVIFVTTGQSMSFALPRRAPETVLASSFRPCSHRRRQRLSTISRARTSN